MTQSEPFRRWFGANVGIEPYVGGRFAMGGFDLDQGGARFVEFEPGRKATLLFADGETDSWELDGSDGKTRLTMRGVFPTAAERTITGALNNVKASSTSLGIVALTWACARRLGTDGGASCTSACCRPAAAPGRARGAGP